MNMPKNCSMNPKQRETPGGRKKVLTASWLGFAQQITMRGQCAITSYSNITLKMG